VLAGFEVPPGEMAGFEAFLDALGYQHQREDANRAYQMFLT
jgi:threonine dehydratase